MRTVNAFIDTNTFLHYQRFDHIEWAGPLGADRVVLVLAPVVSANSMRKKTRIECTSFGSEGKRKSRVKRMALPHSVLSDYGSNAADPRRKTVSYERFCESPSARAPKGCPPQWVWDAVLADALGQAEAAARPHYGRLNPAMKTP